VSPAHWTVTVIGCDGIRSRIRQLLLGEANPASYPGYTYKYCFRALIGTCEARKAIGKNGEYLTSTRFMYNGPDAHVITYPVAMGTFLNVLVVVSDRDKWNTEDGKHTARTTKREAVDFFKSWQHPTVKALVDLLPEELDKWAIFDMLDYPAPKYNDGCVCIAGDAAHAAGPHLGAGAGFGIEDALVLATAIDQVDKKARAAKMTDAERVEMCSKALSAYNQVRYERTQWLVQATREACSLFQARRTSLLYENESIGSDECGPILQAIATRENEGFGQRISRQFLEIWDYDIGQMVKETLANLETTETTDEVQEPWLMSSL
jgi:salicylate hydroxylase